MEKNFILYDLEKYDTKNILTKKINGSLTVVWRDWDKIIKTPQMMYITSVFPKEIKGPHLHKKRTSYFLCIEGSIIFIIKDGDDGYNEIEVNSENPKLICVPNGISSAHVNLSDKISKVLVMADIAWKPNDKEMIDVKFSNYDWKKWNLTNHS